MNDTCDYCLMVDAEVLVRGTDGEDYFACQSCLDSLPAYEDEEIFDAPAKES